MKIPQLATVLVGAILLSMQTTQAQTPIYREVFGNNTAGNANLSTVGWLGSWGPTATDSATPSPNNFGVSAAVGAPNNLDNINAGGPSLSQANGLVFTSGTGASLNNWIAYTTEFTVDPTLTPIQNISFYAGSSANGAFGIPGFRVAVQIGGSWYASTAVFANTVAVASAANFNTGAQMMTFNWTTDASAWSSLDFTPGTSLVLGSTLASPLPGGSITGFGLYSDQEPGAGNATRRFDTFQINPVPEPTSAMLVLAGAGALMVVRRFRKA
ncbi:MAG: PEP-CTERM sorting domain-containing protein [Limisphaerales bacterium]